MVSSENSPTTPDFGVIDLNDDSQNNTQQKRNSSSEEDGVASCNVKKKRGPIRVKKEKM